MQAIDREIKFRVWDKDNEKIVYDPFLFEVYNYSYERRINQKTYRYFEDWRDHEDGRCFECDVMQYVGLKDKNGKEIYEGDILKSETFNRINGPIDDFDMFIYWSVELHLDVDETLEVLGNIYENPELCQ